jgi:PKD repeat protein
MQNPVVVYSSNGLYNISLIASNSCYSDTSYSFVNILEVSLDEKDRSGGVFIYPNPAKDLMVLEGLTVEHSVTFINPAGSTVLQISHISGNEVIDVSALPKGLYLAVISGREGKVTKKIILE